MFRLAGHLKKNISEIRAMDSRDLTEWLAFSTLEPIGDHRADIQAATIACAVISSVGVKCKLADWIPDYDKKVEPETPEEKNKKFRMILGLGK